jgi:arabinogalactan endo-1,4-beta-galactosidase
MVLETAYPWTLAGSDSYNNSFGSQQPLKDFGFSQEGQLEFLKALTREILEGGGIGLIYWEPAWISSHMKDLWGTGSSWENATLFDFQGNPTKGMDFMKFNYK